MKRKYLPLPVPPGGIHLRTMTLAGETFRLACPREPNAVLDACTEEAYGAEGNLPYWAELWPSSLALAEYLLATYSKPMTYHFSSLHGRLCLDLGCGLGLAGISAAKRGARVVFGDLDKNAAAFSRHNAMLNGVDPVGVVVMDWARPPFGRSPHGLFDLILGADVLYENRQLEWVLRFLERHLHPDGEALLGEPLRNVARPFFIDLPREGLQSRELRMEVNDRGRLADVSVWKVTWSGNRPSQFEPSDI